VVDRWGNVVALTQTLGRSFGAEVATPGLGFPYNSLLEGFNFDKPQCPGYLQPGIKCPSDMAPTIVISDDGTLVAALGAPSSSRIPAIIVNVISNLVDRGMGLAEAVEAPRVLTGGLSRAETIIEVANPITATHVDALETMGYTDIERMPYPVTSRRIVLFGGVNAVGWDADSMTFIGVGDRRRWGSAGGPAGARRSHESLRCSRGAGLHFTAK
jgi:gamma-glutamyltranspeptidase/glutathione hydrolase